MSVRGPVLTTAALAVVAVAAALGVVLGTGPGAGAAAAPSPVAASGPAAPDGFARRWSGPLRERNGPTVDVRLTVTSARAATLEIPAFGCTYTGTVPSAELPRGTSETAARSAAELPRGTPETAARSAAQLPRGTPETVRLRTAANPQRLCAAQATVRLTPLGTRSLRYELLRTCDAGGACVRRNAAAALTAR